MTTAPTVFAAQPVALQYNPKSNISEGLNLNDNLKISEFATDNLTDTTLPVSIDDIVYTASKADDNTVRYEATASVTFHLSASSKASRTINSSTALGDVKALLSINYEYRGKDEIKVNKVSGYWEPSNSNIYINSREVHYGDGGGNKAHKYPVSNGFSYSTGWSWVEYKPPVAEANSGARAFSSAIVAASGISPHTLELTVIPKEP